jgi:hypothetical protein
VLGITLKGTNASRTQYCHQAGRYKKDGLFRAIVDELSGRWGVRRSIERSLDIAGYWETERRILTTTLIMLALTAASWCGFLLPGGRACYTWQASRFLVLCHDALKFLSVPSTRGPLWRRSAIWSAAWCDILHIAIPRSEATISDSAEEDPLVCRRLSLRGNCLCTRYWIDILATFSLECARCMRW